MSKIVRYRGTEIMRILQINSFFSVGGPPRIVNGIYDTLKKQGHDCKIAAARKKMYVPDDSIRIGNEIEVYSNALKARLFDNEGRNAKRATKEFIRKIVQYNPDIIQLHNVHGYYINYEKLFPFLKQYGKPIVWTFHDCWPMTGHCVHFDYIGCEKWKNEGCFACPQSNEYPTSIIADSSTINFEKKKQTFTNIKNMTIVTVSEWLKGRVLESFFKEYPVEVIPNGIDLDIFKPVEYEHLSKKYGLCHKKVVLGVAQNWCDKKGLSDCVKLSQKLSSEYQMVLVGLTTKQQKSIPSNIIGICRTNDSNELAAFYTMAHIFVNFSVEETMGLTTVEALACGTPVIVYNKTAVPEVIDHTCGWIVEAHDIDGIISIIKNSFDKSAYSTACRKRAKAYETEKQYSKYVKLYEQILEGR